MADIWCQWSLNVTQEQITQGSETVNLFDVLHSNENKKYSYIYFHM